jgi:DNA polymerase-3 subunit epsilon
MEVPGNSACSSNEVVVLDFETTGLTPLYHRTIEVGAVLVCRNRIEKTFSELMDPGSYIPAFITSLTGISDDMVEGKPAPEEVMPRLREFIGERPIVAHNASFDRRFLTAEMERAGLKLRNPVLCTLLLSRRLYLNLQVISLEFSPHTLGLRSEGPTERSMTRGPQQSYGFILERRLSEKPVKRCSMLRYIRESPLTPGTEFPDILINWHRTEPPVYKSH